MSEMSGSFADRKVIVCGLTHLHVHKIADGCVVGCAT